MAARLSKQSNWWVHVLLSVCCFISLFPAFRILTVAFKPGDRIFSTDIVIIPDAPTWQNFIDVFTGTDFFYWMFNSVIVTLLASVISVSLAATAGYALSRYRFPFKKSVFVFLMSTQMLPAVILLLPLYFMLRRHDLIDTYAGVIFVYLLITLPFCVWLLKGYFDTVPRSLEQAAQVDGLTAIGSFWKVVLPLSTPSLAIAMLFSMTQVWNEYIVARVVLQSSELYTWPLGLFELQGEFDTRWGMFAAASITITIPITAVFLYSSKWLLSGLTLGGVKG